MISNSIHLKWPALIYLCLHTAQSWKDNAVYCICIYFTCVWRASKHFSEGTGNLIVLQVFLAGVQFHPSETLFSSVVLSRFPLNWNQSAGLPGDDSNVTYQFASHISQTGLYLLRMTTYHGKGVSFTSATFSYFPA